MTAAVLAVALLCLAPAAPRPAAPAPPPAPPPAAPLSVDEIVRRAAAQQARAPQGLTCNLVSRAWELDGHGKPGGELRQEHEVSWQGGTLQHGKTTVRSYAGKPFSAEEMKAADKEDEKKRKQLEEAKAKGEARESEPVFAAFRVPLHAFKLLREEPLDGRRAYVLSVEPKPQAGPEGRSGTAWVDAESFVVLRGTYAPKPLPDHVDRMELEERFARTAEGDTVPVLLRTEATGGFWFFKKRVRFESSFEGCRKAVAQPPAPAAPGER